VLSLESSVLPSLPAGLPVAYWVHTPHPFLIQLGEDWGIRFYGLAYLLGFLGAGWLLHRYHKAGRSPLDPNEIWDVMTYIIIGVMVGGRLGSFLLYHPEDLFHPPWAFFMIWKGGMASHGGFIGVIIALAVFARRHRVSFFQLGDLIVSTVPLGLGLGRIANFLNGELWGKVTDVSWGMIFTATGGGEYPRHPSQLYEAALEGFLLLAFVQWRFWKTSVVQRQPGRLAGEFLLGYAVVRIVCEVFREPDAGVQLILGLSRGTFYSVFLIVGGVTVVAAAVWRSTRASHRPK